MPRRIRRDELLTSSKTDTRGPHDETNSKISQEPAGFFFSTDGVGYFILSIVSHGNEQRILFLHQQ